MFDAQLLMYGASVYTPWMARGGDNLRATLDLVDLGGSPEMQVHVFTKKSEDVGDGADPTSGAIDITRSTVGRATSEWEGGLNDWVRYKISFSSGSSGDWVLFRMLSPVWFDTVDA